MLMQGCTWLKSRNSRSDEGIFCGNPVAPGEAQFCTYHAVTKPPLSRSLWAAMADEAAAWRLTPEAVKRLQEAWRAATAGHRPELHDGAR